MEQTRKLPITFNCIPAGCEALVAAAAGEGQLLFKMRGQETDAVPVKQVEDSLKKYAREIVAASESNGYAMSPETFAMIWARV